MDSSANLQMFKLKGSIEIHRFDSRNGQLKEVIKQDNVIPDASLIFLLNWNSTSNFFGNKFISLSTQTTTPTPNSNTLTGIIATGYVPSGVTSPDWYEGIVPPFGQVRNRFDSPPSGIPRTFYTVALSNQSTNNNQASVTGIAYAYVKLDISCTQGSFDVLDVYYRVQFQGLNNRNFLDAARVTRDFGRWLFNKQVTSGFRLSYLYASPAKQGSKNDYSAMYALAGFLVAQVPVFTSVLVGWTTGVAIVSHFKWKMQLSQQRAFAVGTIFSQMLQGASDSQDCAYNSSNLVYDKEPFQTGFFHSSGSATPFFDANAPGNSNGKIFLSGTWAGGWPMLFRINLGGSGTVAMTSAASTGATNLSVSAVAAPGIPSGTLISFTNGISTSTTSLTATGATTIAVAALSSPGIPSGTVGSFTYGSGATGVATYTWSVRRHLGFTGSNYTDLALVGNPYRNPNIQAATGMHGWKEENNDVLRFSDRQIVQYDQSGVTLLDLINGDRTDWDNTTSPAIGAGSSSDIRQCATDGSKIYVADRATGLWVIDVAGGTTSNPVAIACYGVDIGRSGVAWAIFNGSLRNSSNWATLVTFTFTGLTDANWNRTKFLKADPGQADDQLAVVADNGSGTNRIIWYKSTGAIATLGYSNANLKSWPSSLDVADTGGFWAMQSLRLNFGLATTSAVANVPALSLTSSIYGTDSFYKISFFGANLITTAALVSSANATIVSYTSLGTVPYVTHLVGGIVISSKLARQLFTDNVFCWENYGWDGSAWQLNLVSQRASSATPQLLGYGISVAFVDGATPPHFTATDYFTEGVCYGLWKDNATDIFYQSQWYTKPVEFNYPVPPGVTISGGTYTLTAVSDGNFIRIETDAIAYLSAFAIAGIPVAAIYVAGETPGVGEISVNGLTGVVTFNASDNGKVFSGYYAWIRFA